MGKLGIKKLPGILNKLHVNDAESGLILLKSFPTKIHVVIHKTIPLKYVIPFKTVQLNILAIKIILQLIKLPEMYVQIISYEKHSNCR